jgi:hypothetical protein
MHYERHMLASRVADLLLGMDTECVGCLYGLSLVVLNCDFAFVYGQHKYVMPLYHHVTG